MGKRRDTDDPRRPAGGLEAEVLAALWAADRGLTPGEVRLQLGSELAYTTVMTTLSRLHEKGAVQRRRAGRAYRYTPVMDQADIAAARMRDMLEAGERPVGGPEQVRGLPLPRRRARGYRDARGDGSRQGAGAMTLAATATALILSCSFGFWGVVVARRLPPRQATWLLSAGGAVAALSGLAVLALLGSLLAGEQPAVAGEARSPRASAGRCWRTSGSRVRGGCRPAQGDLAVT